MRRVSTHRRRTAGAPGSAPAARPAGGRRAPARGRDRDRRRGRPTGRGHPRGAGPVDGFDVDAPSVEAARRNAAEAGVADRVRSAVADTATVSGTHHVVTAFECVHDLPDPVAVLAAVRRLTGDGGAVLGVDERVAEEFTAPGDEVERLVYGHSLVCCLPDALSTRPSAATGTVVRPATLRRYAREAGFADVQVPDVRDEVFRFYRLV
ncbi:methyltransferase domain-containing protein [Geodermatophilus sp. SYSU D01036]